MSAKIVGHRDYFDELNSGGKGSIMFELVDTDTKSQHEVCA
jgi:hypothetical protein